MGIPTEPDREPIFELTQKEIDRLRALREPGAARYIPAARRPDGLEPFRDPPDYKAGEEAKHSGNQGPSCTFYFDLNTGEPADDPEQAYRELFPGIADLSLRYVRYPGRVNVEIGDNHRHNEFVSPGRWDQFLDLIGSGKLSDAEKETVVYGFVKEGFGCLIDGEDDAYRNKMRTFISAVKGGRIPKIEIK